MKSTAALVHKGYPIKQAARLAKQESKEEAVQMTVGSDPAEFLAALEEAGQQMNDVKLVQLLQQAQYTFGIDSLIQDILLPFLERIGQLWCEDAWGEFQEAVSSQTIRDFLAQIRRSLHVSDQAPLVIGSCLPGERHEIPMQILLLQFTLRGYRTIMIGPSPAPGAIQSAVEQSNPQLVVLTASTTVPFIDGGVLLRELDEFANSRRHCKFFIGGKGAAEQITRLNLSAITFAETIETVLSAVSD